MTNQQEVDKPVRPVPPRRIVPPRLSSFSDEPSAPVPPSPQQVVAQLIKELRREYKSYDHYAIGKVADKLKAIGEPDQTVQHFHNKTK